MSRSPGVVRAADGLPRLDAVLQREALSWERFEKLVDAELEKQMTRAGMYLDPDRRAEALDWCLEKAAIAARKYDPEEARRLGISFTTYLTRMMPYGVVDWLRATRGDARRGTPLQVILTDDGVMPESTYGDSPDLDEAIAEVESRLSPEALWAFQHMGRPVIDGVPLPVAVAATGLPPAEALTRWRTLCSELGFAA